MKALPVQGLSCTHDAKFFVMANAEHIAKLNEGVEAWNLWRMDQQVVPDLSGDDFTGRNLSGADLRSANFENANLQGATLGRGTMLRDANFRHSNLSHADLSGADLQDTHFADADLRDASLRETNLLGADLSEAVGGLRTEQYAGADLTGAKLPAPLEKLYDSLENVKGISESARKIFLAALAGCLYCWLTIATTTDVNLITNRASSPLPIIQTQIPIVGFYVVAPLLVLCVYFYLHFYLQKLWEELGSMPAVFPDGRPLYAKVDPWLLNDLVRAHLPKLKANRPFLSHFQLWISVLLAWWIVPVTMFLFWGRYLRRHEQVWTSLHVSLLVISATAGVCLYRLAKATLAGAERKPFIWTRGLAGLSNLTAAFAVGAAVLLSWVSWETRWGAPNSLVPHAMAKVGYSPFANLDYAEVSQKKPSWIQANATDPDSVIPPRLSGVNLRYASAFRAFFNSADLVRADLIGASLEQASLVDAQLIGANLAGAYLDEADLRGANLVSANLSLSSLRLANAGGANMSSANLSGASMGGADLSGAQLWHSRLTYTSLARFQDSEGVWMGKQIDPERVTQADNWDQAFYDQEILGALCLPADHNGRLADKRKNRETAQEERTAHCHAPQPKQ